MRTHRTIELKVFISSAMDLKKERAEISNFIETNFKKEILSHKYNNRVSLVPVKFETLPPNTGESQNAIDEKQLKVCDLLIGVLWSKYGEMTAKEIMYFIESKKPAMVYFINDAIGDTKTILANRDEFDKIEKFKNEIQPLVMYKSLSPGENILESLKSDLPQVIEDLIKTEKSTYKNNTSKPNDTNITSASVSLIKPWFEISISNTLNSIMKQKLNQAGLKQLADQVKFHRSFNHFENIKFWKEIVQENEYDKVIKLADSAREESFSHKYGNYNYLTDLRSKYKKWADPLSKYVSNHFVGKKSKLSVLAVAANYGKEIEDIFPSINSKSTKYAIKVVDISSSALDRGRNCYKKIDFVQGLMESIPVGPSSHDVYLNLRSIHSRGVSMDDTIMEAHRVLKKGGLAVISVSNGYLVRSKEGGQLDEQIGMYDNIKNYFSEDLPFEVAGEVRRLLSKFSFKKTFVQSYETEIFIFATK